MNRNIALIGNPNCGKTTLFNALTGKYQRTGNWTGVTTDSVTANYKKDASIKITDLPGTYSLNAYSLDEKAVIKHLKENTPDVIINVLDGLNLERNLYLTTYLSSLDIPVVIAINFADQLKNNNVYVNEEKLKDIFGVPVVKISAIKNVGIDELIAQAKNAKNSITCNKLKDETSSSRYAFVETIIESVVTKKLTRGEIFTQKADKILLHKFFALPIFFLVVTILYFLSITGGSFFGSIILSVLDGFENNVRSFFIENNVPTFLINLSCDAIIKGVSTVCSFLPQILILFALLTLLEQSGYASRIAFILDRIFRAFGLSGKSIIPMMLCSGCAVSGIMSTRTIAQANERRMTIFLSPFIPCGAKMAVFGWFSTIFFNGSALIATSMYFLAILCTAVFGWLLNKLKCFKNKGNTLILEMPLLRAPHLKDVCFVLKEKLKEFIVKAGTIIFLISIVLWFLQNFGVRGYTFGEVENSFLVAIGNIIKYVFYPLGFGNWQASVALVSGIFAKEAVVETLILTTTSFHSLFYNNFSVYAFMAFVLLSPPCVASLAIAKNELKSKKWFLFMLVFQFISAYIIALIINLIGFIFTDAFGLLLSAIIVIIISVATLKCVKHAKNSKCKSCSLCSKGGKKCQNKKRYTI